MMIKVPVSVGSIGTSNYHTSSCYPLLLDANFKPLNNECAKEAAKRISMHDELVAAVNELIPSFIHDSWTEEDGKRIMYFYELLERCK